MSTIASLTRQRYESLFRDTYKRYYHLALHVVGDGDAARDIVSDVFVILWERRETIQEERVESWLFRCVRNASIDYLNRQKTTGGTLSIEAVMAIPDESAWQDTDERVEKLQQLLSTMPPKTRHVLTQRYEQRQTYQEVAEEMGISTNGVKKHVVKALRMLREKMAATPRRKI